MFDSFLWSPESSPSTHNRSSSYTRTWPSLEQSQRPPAVQRAGRTEGRMQCADARTAAEGSGNQSYQGHPGRRTSVSSHRRGKEAGVFTHQTLPFTAEGLPAWTTCSPEARAASGHLQKAQGFGNCR